MAAEAITTVSEVREYRAEWQISNLTVQGSKSHRTPVFYPIPNVEVGFCFQIWYRENSVHQPTCELTLNKILCTGIPVDWKMELDVKYFGPSNVLLKQCAPKTAIIVKEMSSLGIMNSDYLPNVNFKTYLNNGVLKCCMKFFDLPHFPLSNRLNSGLPSSLDHFAEDFGSIYSPCVLSDLQFKVGNMTLNAHKSVLAAHSPVFLKMFTHDCLESQTNSVAIADTADSNFESFLKYLYSGKIEDKSFPNLMDLFVLADKYDVRSLKRECAKTAATLLSVENIFDILVIVYGFPGQEIQAPVKEFAASHIKALLPDEKWNDLVKSYPVIAYEIMAEVHRISESSK